MDDEVLVNNYHDEGNESCGLSKNEVIKLLYNQDNNIALVAPEKFKSPIWERFRVVYFKGVKLNFVQCIGCSLVLVYKSRTGTASLLRHRCARFPISVYDLKLAAAGHHIDMINEMASSSHNGNIELKQEMLSDEESLEINEENGDNESDQQFTNEQTNKGLMESFSLLEKTFMTGDERVEDVMMTREEVEIAQRHNDPFLFFERPRNHRHSNTWDRFEIVYYRDVRQNFAKCLSCSSIVSYKKTTGTASLIRHKCKGKSIAKSESLINLLTQPKQDSSTLAPAPVFDVPSSSSTTVSSTATIKQTPPQQTKQPVVRSENISILELAGRNLAMSQIHWLSQSLTSTETITDPTYLNFLQNLVNFGADFGKQKISSIINRNLICQLMIPKRCEDVQMELMNVLKDTEFSISFRRWTNAREENFVTVFAYFFTMDFEYRTHILGSRKLEDDEEVLATVKEIADGFKTVKETKLKCVCEIAGEDFEAFPCIIGQISNVITTAINASSDSKKLLRKLFDLAHRAYNIPMKTSFDESTDEQRIKIFYEIYQHVKSNDTNGDPVVEKFMHLFGSLFSAITNLTETSDSGTRCVTANKVYLWFKKLLKYYSNHKSDDQIAGNILRLLESIKIHEIYQVAVFLDPNFKNLKFLDSPDRSNLLDIVKKNLQQMMGDDDDSPPMKKQKCENGQAKSHVNDTFLEFMDITMESIDDQVNSEIQCYMGHKLDNPVDIVDYWRENDCFPYLKRLARNFLNLPSCTFHSKCCFLSADNGLYQKCQNLSTDDVETLTFLHQNL